MQDDQKGTHTYLSVFGEEQEGHHACSHETCTVSDICKQDKYTQTSFVYLSPMLTVAILSIIIVCVCVCEGCVKGV